MSNRQFLAANKRRLAETKRKDGQARPDASPTRAALYEEATRKGLAGRSRMTKAGLQAALQAAR